MNRDDGGSAFPEVKTIYNNDTSKREVDSRGGMTLRDYFAAKAMQALIAAEPERDANYLSFDAFEFADAMLALRDR